MANLQLVSANRADFRTNSTAFQPPLLANLHAYYLNDEANMLVDGSDNLTSWKDTSGNHRTLLPDGPVPRVLQGGRYMAGFTNTRMAAAGAFPTGGDYTLVLQVVQQQLRDSCCFIASEIGHAVIARGGGAQLGHFTGSYITEPAHNIPAGNSYVLVVTYNAATNTGTTYVNGVQLAAGSGGSANAQGKLLLGEYGGGAFRATDLLLGRVALYNAVLDNASIQAWQAELA